MLRRLRAENNKLVDGKKPKGIPGYPDQEKEDDDKSLTEVEEMSNEEMMG